MCLASSWPVIAAMFSIREVDRSPGTRKIPFWIRRRSFRRNGTTAHANRTGGLPKINLLMIGSSFRRRTGRDGSASRAHTLARPPTRVPAAPCYPIRVPRPTAGTRSPLRATMPGESTGPHWPAQSRPTAACLRRMDTDGLTRHGHQLRRCCRHVKPGRELPEYSAVLLGECQQDVHQLRFLAPG
jgi:hypothetical protein